MRSITNEQRKRIMEIIEKEGYNVLGMDKQEDVIFIGIVPKEHKQISKNLSDKIEKELGVNAIINL